MHKAWLLGLSTCVLATLPAIAGAQFFYRLNVNSIGATTCTTTTAQTAISGDLDWNLPPTPNNVRLSRKVNADPAVVAFESATPFSFDNFPATLIVVSLPAATPLPYIATAEALPADNGTPVGTGWRATWICDVNGGGTFSVVEVAVPTPVPATSAYGLAALAALLSLSGMASMRRRARRRPVA